MGATYRPYDDYGYDPRIAAERATKRAAAQMLRGETISLVAARFPQVLPRGISNWRLGDPAGVTTLQNVLLESRWRDDLNIHARNSAMEVMAREWTRELHDEFVAYLESYEWAAIIPDMPHDLRMKGVEALKNRDADRAQAERDALAAARERERQSNIRLQERREREDQARLAAAREKALADLEADLEDLTLDSERAALGGGTW